MPDRTGYQPIASQSLEEDEEDVGESLPTTTHGLRRNGVPSIDLSKLDNAFKRWTESIAQKVRSRRKKKVEDHSKKEIWRSVFEPPVISLGDPSPFEMVKTLDHKPPMSHEDFEIISQGVRSAIMEGIHPKMITKGSSGSYFARSKVDGRVQTVAVFKPKDEEPYGRLNPKTTKWIHRQLRWIIPFGRACLIPNLSYVSEAAASLLDQRLKINIVPRTELVSLSSSAFFYDWMDRNAAKRGKQLPEKVGSMQYFLHGYTDATEFLRRHPWPGRAIADTFDDDTHRKGGLTKRFMSAMKVVCGKTGDEEDLDDDVGREEEQVLFDGSESDSTRPFYWSLALQQSFRDELEKLVILDYLMLNTDRGADNYMIKYCDGDHEKTLVDVAPSKAAQPEMPLMSELRRSETSSSSPNLGVSVTPSMLPMSSSPTLGGNYTRQPHIHIAAIDNSLSFPHEHPKGWRSYTYGWLYLPVSIIGTPFSEKTRNHFLPLLTSKEWWEDTTFELRKLFAVDPDFHPKMFSRQLAVIKGQAWNIVQSLKHSDEGPLELTRRTKVLVWDDETEISEEVAAPDPVITGPLTASPKMSISSFPLPRGKRSQSVVSDFPPPMRRTSTEISRPVPFVSKFKKVHPGTTGVTVLEHLERLDAVEAGLKRLGSEGASYVDDEDMMERGEVVVEVDVGESSSSTTPKPPFRGILVSPPTSQNLEPSPFSPIGGEAPLPTVPEVESCASSISEQDLVTLSKSLSHVPDGNTSARQSRFSMHGRIVSETQAQQLDWLHADEGTKRIVIVERLETVDTEPLCACW